MIVTRYLLQSKALADELLTEIFFTFFGPFIVGLHMGNQGLSLAWYTLSAVSCITCECTLHITEHAGIYTWRYVQKFLLFMKLVNFFVLITCLIGTQTVYPTGLKLHRQTNLECVLQFFLFSLSLRFSFYVSFLVWSFNRCNVAPQCVMLPPFSCTTRFVSRDQSGSSISIWILSLI